MDKEWKKQQILGRKINKGQRKIKEQHKPVFVVASLRENSILSFPLTKEVGFVNSGRRMWSAS